MDYIRNGCYRLGIVILERLGIVFNWMHQTENVMKLGKYLFCYNYVHNLLKWWYNDIWNQYFIIWLLSTRNWIWKKSCKSEPEIGFFGLFWD